MLRMTGVFLPFDSRFGEAIKMFSLCWWTMEQISKNRTPNGEDLFYTQHAFKTERIWLRY